MRGPLHGIPVLFKDNIATDDPMETTAGSLALLGARSRRRDVVANLRASRRRDPRQDEPERVGQLPRLPAAGLSFATNFLNGWSAAAGSPRPYLLGLRPVRLELRLRRRAGGNLAPPRSARRPTAPSCAPPATMGSSGLKPTIGLVAQNGIIPIATSQDTAGPMSRTVRDAAILLNVLKSPFGPVPGSVARDYTDFLDAARSRAPDGIDRRQFLPDYFALRRLIAVVDRGDRGHGGAGATIVDPVDPGDTFASFDAEFTCCCSSSRAHRGLPIGLRHTRIRTLADLIDFNRAHCERGDAVLRAGGLRARRGAIG